ncbi:MAG: hypothetical protein AB1443_05955 [Pseudomonadota bacterium]
MWNLARTIGIRIWVEIAASLRWHAGKYLPLISSRLGHEGLIIALEQSDGDSACSILKECGAQIGKDVRICRGLTIHNGENGLAKVSIGDQCHIGRQVFFDLADRIEIGNRVTISMRAMVLTHTHAGSSTSAIRPSSKKGKVVLKDDCYIGAGAILLSDVTVGLGAVVAAGAVVTRDVEDGVTVAGIPAKVIGKRTN